MLHLELAFDQNMFFSNYKIKDKLPEMSSIHVKPENTFGVRVSLSDQARLTKAFAPVYSGANVTRYAQRCEHAVCVKQWQQAEVAVCMSFLWVSAVCISILTAYAGSSK